VETYLYPLMIRQLRGLKYRNDHLLF